MRFDVTEDDDWTPESIEKFFKDDNRFPKTPLTIEIAPASWTPMTYDEAVVYCFVFEHDGKKGWRLPTYDEYLNSTGSVFSQCWYLDDKMDHTRMFLVVPVRDIK
jgi:hypothetical protein